MLLEIFSGGTGGTLGHLPLGSENSNTAQQTEVGGSAWGGGRDLKYVFSALEKPPCNAGAREDRKGMCWGGRRRRQDELSPEGGNRGANQILFSFLGLKNYMELFGPSPTIWMAQI